MIVSRTELATAANVKLRERGLQGSNARRRIKYLLSNRSSNIAWKMLQIREVANATAFDLTENQLEALISALYRIGKVSINDFLTN